MICNHNNFSFVKSTEFEFLVIKSISFIVTQFFHFNELKILRQPGYLIIKLNQQYFLQCSFKFTMNFVGILIVLTECCHQFQMKL